MHAKTEAIISIIAVVLSTVFLVLVLMPRNSGSIGGWIPAEQGQITRVTFTVGSPNGMISAILNNTYTSEITIHYIYVNNTQQPIWTCYVDGVATNPAVVPANSGAAFNITTTVVAGSRYDIKLVSEKGDTFEYTGSAPS